MKLSVFCPRVLMTVCVKTAQDARQNQIESKPAIEAEVVESEASQVSR